MSIKPSTYCNPLPLPHFQPGTACRNGREVDFGWQHAIRRDFREMADPTVIRFDGEWYLFPSCGMVWHSRDLVQWTHRPIQPPDIGYAPTVVERQGWFYLTACSDQMWLAPHPLGPWQLLGTVRDEHGQRFKWDDPMLFVDGDGTMYCYHGLGKDGIYVARLRDDDPTQFAAPRIHCFAFNPKHAWERFGEHHQDPDLSYIEGAWMTHRDGRYFLQYSGPGTEWKCYAVGAYVSSSPTGPWKPQQRNPILSHRGGLVNGCGHHSIVEGPGGTLWCFYTTLVRIEHRFERRIGMDPVGFDGNGEMFVNGPTETPQLAPGLVQDPARGNDAGMWPLSVNESVRASSAAPGHEPVYAVDDNIRTWWEASEAGPAWLSVDLHRAYQVSAARTLFGDRGLDYAGGVTPGPYRYRIEGSLDDAAWFTLFDQTENTVDRHINYDHFPARAARHVRLTVLAVPPGMVVSAWEFTVFGRTGP